MIPIEKRLSYSIGMKINTGNYENIDVHVSESTAFATEGMDPSAIEKEVEQEYLSLREKVDQRLVDVVAEVKQNAS